MSEMPQDLAQVEELLAERDALHGWLAKLDAAGSATPAAVRDRVRADYRARLDGVAERLADHRDTLAEKLAEDREEYAALAARMQAAREALAEVELRHSVGEFDGKRFEAERRSHVGDLESFEVSVTAIAERIARLEDAQAVVSRAPSEPPLVSIVDLEVEPEDEAAPEDEPEAEEVAAPGVEASSSEADGDELQTDALLAIFGDGGDEGGAAVDDEVDGEREGPAPEVAGTGPLSFTRSGEFPVASGRRKAPPPPLGMPAADQKPRFVRPATERGSELTEAAGSAREQVRVIHDPEPVIPETSSESEASPRTLRCGECGAMNRPLEWYCEKCGAELSAI